MKWLLAIIGVLGALALLTVAIGSRLPREHQASSQITVTRPIDEVWAVIRDFGALPGYWPDIKKAERLVDRGEPGPFTFEPLNPAFIAEVFETHQERTGPPIGGGAELAGREVGLELGGVDR